MKRAETRIPNRRRSARRGVSAIWTIITLPVFLVLICFVVNIGNLWLARAELETSLEAAALAAVKQRGDSPERSTQEARNAGAAYAALNPVRGQAVVLDAPRGNRDAGGELVFGTVTRHGSLFRFHAGDDADHPGHPNQAGPMPGVHARATVRVPLVCSAFGGFNVPDYQVTAQVTAVFDPDEGRPRLVRIDSYSGR